MPIELDGVHGQRIREGLADVKNYLDNSLKPQLSSAVGQHGGLPQEVTQFLGELHKLEQALIPGSGVSSAASIPDNLAPILATVAAFHRRKFATELDERASRTLASELLQNLHAARATVDDLLASKWYLSTSPLRLPRLRDFVAPSRYEREPPPPIKRQKDDKFGILWSASHVLGDLSQLREDCIERFTPLAIAFIDVDGLKALNTEFGETWVDALILPPLMRSVEHAIFGHGSAYRYGGDEFVVLMPSSGMAVALAILQGLRDELRKTSFERVGKPPTVSVGVCLLYPDSPLTDREALHWAAIAKRKAKETRDAIAFVTAERTISNLEIGVVRPKE